MTLSFTGKAVLWMICWATTSWPGWLEDHQSNIGDSFTSLLWISLPNKTDTRSFFNHRWLKLSKLTAHWWSWLCSLHREDDLSSVRLGITKAVEMINWLLYFLRLSQTKLNLTPFLNRGWLTLEPDEVDCLQNWLAHRWSVPCWRTISRATIK